MQKWEYITFKSVRKVSGLPASIGPWMQNFDLKQLGEDGWELIAAYPLVSVMGDAFAGITTEVDYIFKRPKA